VNFSLRSLDVAHVDDTKRFVTGSITAVVIELNWIHKMMTKVPTNPTLRKYKKLYS